ncbi:MAG: DNA-binding protein [Clostridia bacterium]|nr:DNA-binding protein [Clostridia bacterium]
MNIEERVEIAILIKYYGKMLTDRQLNILDMYVDNNLSLAEVSEELNISRQAVKDALDTSFNALKNMEEKLGFIARDEKLKAIIEDKELSQIDMATRLEIIALLEDN